MATQIIRDSPLGQLIRIATKNKAFQYPEEKPGFALPWKSAEIESDSDTPEASKSRPASVKGEAGRPNWATPREQDGNLDLEKTVSKASTTRIPPSRGHDGAALSHHLTKTSTISRKVTREQTEPFSAERLETEREEALQKEQSAVIVPTKTADGVILVDWYTTDDPENPQNWALKKKVYVTTQLWLYTFVVYCASAIYTPASQGVMEEFGVGIPKAALGLSMYVLGYGFGPLLFSPLSEIPSIGRNIPYITTFTLFVILGFPTAVVDNYAGLLVLRFLTGFLGSPCLATGGATIQDIYSFMNLPYGFVAWTAGAFSAPALGPLLSGFAVMAKGWRWALWEIIWMSAPVLVMMFVSFPETSASNILLHRARRLRKLTGNTNYKAQSEINQANMSVSQVAKDALIKPMEITALDPAILFTNGYTALIYGIYYTFFEVFPLVYIDIYHFNIGTMGIVFTNVIVGCIIGIVIYCAYVKYYLNPDIMKNGMRSQEHRLVPALFASLGLPAGLFIFAWTSRESVHWIASVIGITIFAASAFVLMQCIFIYLPLSYPQYAASLFAANDTWRSCLAAGSIIYGHPLFVNLGIGPGVSLLGGLAAGGVIGIWLLWFYGAKLRARSKFAIS
ncbi:MAG: hypothetical protein M1831_007048 [Alyxoria varia]|nr:MAG: hypothetical protein M1831_007048 [Alyxoria varia]